MLGSWKEENQKPHLICSAKTHPQMRSHYGHLDRLTASASCCRGSYWVWRHDEQYQSDECASVLWTD